MMAMINMGVLCISCEMMMTMMMVTVVVMVVVAVNTVTCRMLLVMRAAG